MKSFNVDDFLVKQPVSLRDTPTVVETEMTKKEMMGALKLLGKTLATMQNTMYAHNRYGVLICLQGMDTSGKDSLIREVFSKFNPRGMVVHSFKKPSKKELQHDFLWRHYRVLPERGKYAVFNRSHYENVLVTRVNPKLLLSENLPKIESVNDIHEGFWTQRFKQIINFEEHIVQNGFIVFKFFLHLSKDEQRIRLLRRLEKNDKMWKFDLSDLSERKRWDDYMDAYEDVINKTSMPHAPWFVIPADDKTFARYMVAKILCETMAQYTDITKPKPNDAILENLEVYKEKLSE